jgi:NitT/TauT family transport system substrate-binding protein
MLSPTARQQARPHLRPRARIALALALTALLTGCSALNGPTEKDTPVPGTTVEKPTITVGILAALDYAPVKIAQAQGLFRAEGLDVHVKILAAGPPALADLASGGLDVTLVNYVTLFQTVSHPDNRNLEVVADAFQADKDGLVLLGKGDTALTQPKDLIGKTVSVHQRSSVADLLLEVMLRDNGVDPNLVHRAEVKFPQIPAALATGQIDAGVELEPYIRQGENAYGLRPLQDHFTLIGGQTDNLPLSGYAVTKTFAQKNSRTVAAFQRAMEKAQKIASTDPAQVLAVLPDLTGLDKTMVKQVHIGADAYPVSLDVTRLQRVADLMYANKYLQQPINAADYVLPTPSN